MYFNYFFSTRKSNQETAKSFNYSTRTSAQYLVLIAFKQVQHLSTWKCFFSKVHLPKAFQYMLRHILSVYDISLAYWYRKHRKISSTKWKSSVTYSAHISLTFSFFLLFSFYSTGKKFMVFHCNWSKALIV